MGDITAWTVPGHCLFLGSVLLTEVSEYHQQKA